MKYTREAVEQLYLKLNTLCIDIPAKIATKIAF